MPDIVFTKDNLDSYLKELAKECRKRGGKKAPAEIILVGGAAILANYGFREMTTDIDAVIRAASFMKDAINAVADRLDLPNGWLNTDFMRTSSYSPRLAELSVPYKSFFGVLDVRTVADAYLIAMKLRSGRRYKNDLSDIVGILAENGQRDNPIGLEQIRSAYEELYGEPLTLSDEIRSFLDRALTHEHLAELYSSARNAETASKERLLSIEQEYPGVTNHTNVNEILDSLQKKADRETVLAALKAKEKKPR